MGDYGIEFWSIQNIQNERANNQNCI